MDILVVPDAHATPKVTNERFDWLGNLILDRKPDVIVQIGDLFSMDALSSFDKGKRSFEGRRYRDDLDVGIDAQERMFAPIEKYNKLRKNKYNPRKVITLGNHEYRIEKATNDAAEFHEFISFDDLRLEEFGWEVYPFKSVVTINGVNFSHYFESGAMGRPISGENIGKSILNKKRASAVQGHSHLLSVASETRLDGKRIWGVSAGCYLEHKEDYFSQTVSDTFWKGVVMLHDVEDGDMNIETINMEKIKRLYR